METNSTSNSDIVCTDSSGTITVSADRVSGALDVLVDILEDIQRLVSQGRPKVLRIKLGDKVVAELPLALTATAAIAAGLAAVLLTRLAVEIEHE